VSVALSGIPAEIVNLIQERVLERIFHDALFPRLLYRAEAVPELWPVNLGERMAFTRVGLMPVTMTPLVPGADPVPGSYASEQWEAEARQFGNAIDTHMPSSYVTLAPLFLRNTQQLGMSAGQTMNRLVRNRLFVAYLGGNTNVIVVAAIGVTAITVAAINGFTERVLNGRPQPVSAVNPIPVTFTGGEPANTVIGAVPNNPADPLGPGVLTLGAALTVGLALRAGVQASTRSRIFRVGGGATVDALTVANILTLQDIITTVSRLRDNNVPPHADGFYHVHVTPTGEAELFADNQFQRLWQSIPGESPYKALEIGQLVGCRFYRNTESPNQTNVGTLTDTSGGAGSAREAAEIEAEVINQTGVSIQRALVLGGGAVYEKYLDEGKYITEAGVTGKIGEFAITNNGVAIMTNRIRFILRSPLDRLQQVVSQAWSWSGDFAIPSDGLVGDGARFKRAICIEHA
jgi:N4-gp56 family major capsid protein